jgi:hypothetical protein
MLTKLIQMLWKLSMHDNINKLISCYDEEIKICKSILKELKETDFAEMILYKTQLSEKRMFLQTLKNLAHTESSKVIDTERTYKKQ